MNKAPALLMQSMSERHVQGWSASIPLIVYDLDDLYSDWDGSTKKTFIAILRHYLPASATVKTWWCVSGISPPF